MEQPYVICTDTGADIPWRTAQQQQIDVAHLHYTMNDAAYVYDLGRDTDLTAFYFAMRNGTAVRTIPVLIETYCALWASALAEGKDVLYLSLSSALSATFAAAKEARAEMLRQYPKRRIVLIDTQSCSVAQGMLAFEAAQMLREGRKLDEVAEWLVENRAYVHGMLITPNTAYLKNAKFPMGNVSGLKSGLQSICLDQHGGIFPLERFRSQEETFSALTTYVAENGFALKAQVPVIAHADEPALAATLKEALLADTECVDATVLPMGPITGCYVGPGAIGVAFFGSRKP